MATDPLNILLGYDPSDPTEVSPTPQTPFSIPELGVSYAEKPITADEYLEKANLSGSSGTDYVPEEKDITDIFKQSVSAGLVGLETDVEYFKALGNTLLGDEEAAIRNIRRARVLEQEGEYTLGNVEEFKDFIDAPTVEGFFRQVSKGTGMITPSAVTSIVSAGTAALVAGGTKVIAGTTARNTAKRLIQDSLERTAKGVADPDELALAQASYQLYQQGVNSAIKKGAIGGAFGAEFVPMAGGNVSEVLQSDKELTPTTALTSLGVAAPQAAVGVFGEIALLKLLGKVATKRGGSDDKSLIRELGSNITKSFGKGAAIEGTTEFIQESMGSAYRASMDDTFSKQDAALRIAEASFAGFFGGGAIGGIGGAGGTAIANSKPIVDKAKQFLNDAREWEVNRKITEQQYGDVLSGFTTEEPQADINAQVDAMFDPTSSKRAVWVAGDKAEFQAKENESTPVSVNGKIAYSAFIPGRGTILSTNRGIVDQVVTSNGSDKALQIALGFSDVKSEESANDIVVQVFNAEGNVVSEEVTDELGLSRAQQAANKLMPQGGRVEIVNDVAAVMESRRQRLLKEQPVVTKPLDIDEDDTAVRIVDAEGNEVALPESLVPAGEKPFTTREQAQNFLNRLKEIDAIKNNPKTLAMVNSWVVSAAPVSMASTIDTVGENVADTGEISPQDATDLAYEGEESRIESDEEGRPTSKIVRDSSDQLDEASIFSLDGDKTRIKPKTATNRSVRENESYAPRKSSATVYESTPKLREEFAKVFEPLGVQGMGVSAIDWTEDVFGKMSDAFLKAAVANQKAMPDTLISWEIGEDGRYDLYSSITPDTQLIPYTDEDGEKLLLPLSSFIAANIERATKKPDKGKKDFRSNRVEIKTPDGESHLLVNPTHLTNAGQRLVEVNTGSFQGTTPKTAAREGIVAMFAALIELGYDIKLDGVSFKEEGSLNSNIVFKVIGRGEQQERVTLEELLTLNSQIFSVEGIRDPETKKKNVKRDMPPVGPETIAQFDTKAEAETYLANASTYQDTTGWRITQTAGNTQRLIDNLPRSLKIREGYMPRTLSADAPLTAAEARQRTEKIEEERVARELDEVRTTSSDVFGPMRRQKTLKTRMSKIDPLSGLIVTSLDEAVTLDGERLGTIQKNIAFGPTKTIMGEKVTDEGNAVLDDNWNVIGRVVGEEVRSVDTDEVIGKVIKGKDDFAYSIRKADITDPAVAADARKSGKNIDVTSGEGDSARISEQSVRGLRDDEGKPLALPLNRWNLEWGPQAANIEATKTVPKIGTGPVKKSKQRYVPGKNTASYPVGEIKSEGKIFTKAIDLAIKALGGFNNPVSIMGVKELQALPVEQFNALFTDPAVAAEVRTQLDGLINNRGTRFGRYLGFGNAHIILVDNRSGNTLEHVLTTAHELGHVFFEESKNKVLGDNNLALRERLLRDFEKARSKKDAPSAYQGQFGFEEWFSDQVAMWAFRAFRTESTRRYFQTNRMDWAAAGKALGSKQNPSYYADKKEPKGVVERYFYNLVAKLNSMYKQLSKGLRQRFRDYSPDFDAYIQEVIARNKHGMALNETDATKMASLPFRKKLIVRAIEDQARNQVATNTVLAIQRAIGKLILNPKIRGITRIVITEDSVLRSISERIADMMYIPAQATGKGSSLGFVKAKQVLQKRIINHLGKILGEDPKSWDSPENKAALDIAASSTPTTEIENLKDTPVEVRNKARKIRRYLESLYDRVIATTPGNEIPKRKDYFPVALNLAELLNNSNLLAEFKEVVIKYNPELGKETKGGRVVDLLVEEMFSRQEGVIEDTTINANPLDPLEKVNRARKLTNNIPLEELAKFSLPPAQALLKYARHIAIRTEFLKATRDADGNDILVEELKKLNNSEYDEAVRIIERHLGYNVHPFPKWMTNLTFGKLTQKELVTLNSSIQLFNWVTILPLVTIGSLSEMGGAILNSKELDWNTFQTAWNVMKDTLRNQEEAISFAKDLGVVAAATMENVAITDADNEFLDPRVRELSNTFFEVVGLEWFTNFTRVFASNMGVQFLLTHAENKTGNFRSERYLRDLGVTAADVKAWEANNRSFNSEEGKRVQAALTRFVESSMLRPNTAERPYWANDPRFALIWQLKSFFYSFSKQILGGIRREMLARGQEGTDIDKLGGITMTALLAGIAFMPLTMISLELRELVKTLLADTLPGVNDWGGVRYFRSNRMDWGDYAYEIFERAGFLGVGSIAIDMMNADKWGKTPLAPLLGPTWEAAESVVNDGWEVIPDRFIPLYATVY